MSFQIVPMSPGRGDAPDEVTDEHMQAAMRVGFGITVPLSPFDEPVPLRGPLPAVETANRLAANTAVDVVAAASRHLPELATPASTESPFSLSATTAACTEWALHIRSL